MATPINRWAAAVSVALMAVASVAVADVPPSETPSLREEVAAGKLPPISKRLPRPPLVVDLEEQGREPGRHGGSLRMLMGSQKDIRMITAYGYARLVAYNSELKIVPDILQRIDIVDDKVFTLHLRENHKWSDGHPFTAEDFRYYWEDIANNKKLSPFGPPKALIVDSEKPQFEVIDATTVRYTWTNPNPYFLPQLAGSRPLYIYRPAHYLKRFHARYVERKAMRRLLRKERARNWAVLHTRMDHPYRFDNPELPTLQPWQNTTQRPAQRFVFERNPYYHRIDTRGQQLPYFDQLIVNIASSRLIPAKTGVGETDLQARYLRFDNYTFLKEGEERHGHHVRLWRTARGAKLALYPNLNAEDPVWRRLMRDVRFRRALSLAINRHEINQVVFFGLAREGNNTVLRESPLYRPEYQKTWTEFDLAKANKLLDEIGLTQRNDRGLRLLPDGRPVEIIIDTAGESTEETDVLELVHDSWLKTGIKLHPRPSQREVFRNRVFAGLAIMSVWAGLENGVPTQDMSPGELAPTYQHQLQWPKWGQYYDTSGKAGTKPELPQVRELASLNEAWRRAKSSEERGRIWHRMLSIHADQVFTIGIVSAVLQPVVVSRRIRNVPVEGMYNWDPGAYFGIYRLETFWFADTR